jgi:uncharacterized protein (TIGR00661 family)
MAAKEIVESAGHEIVGVVVGMGRERKLPDYFASAMPVALTVIPTLEFAFTGNRSVNMPATIARALRRLPEYARSVRALAALVRERKPDVILNFYEVLTGVYALTYSARPPIIALGHQFLQEHPDFPTMREMRAQQAGLMWYTRIVGARSTWLALSHYEAPDLPHKRLSVAPPLLRRHLFELETDPAGNFVLVYMVNHGYAEHVLQWHARHPETEIHCFYDKPGAPKEFRQDDTLTFHRLDGELFLQMMAGCKCVVSTAGFESVAEAGVLGKAVFMVPVEGHVEQMLNALDGVKAGLGAWGSSFDLDGVARLPARTNGVAYRAWVMRAREILLWAIEGAKAQSTSAGRHEVISQQ